MSEKTNTHIMDISSEKLALDRGVQGVVGKPIDRIEGPAKATGTAAYSYEQTAPGTAYGYVLMAEIARGKITRIDTSAAKAAPAVIAVITDHKLIPSDGLAGREAERHNRNNPDISAYGQGYGIVIAENFEAARAAALMVKVDYATDTPRAIISEHLAEADPAPKGALIPNINRGNFDEAFAASAVKLDVTYITPHHFPVALEPHATVATWNGDRLEIRSSLQLLKSARTMIAASLEIPFENVRVLAPYVGGGFGGKTGVGPEILLAAIAARETGRPVKIALTRRQTAHLVHHRSEAHQRIRLGCDADGRIQCFGHDSLVSQKDNRSMVEPVPLGSLAIYAGAVRSFTTGLVRLDLPPAGAVRAPGEAIGTLALETAMDELAEQFGMDPIAFRKLNEPEKDPLRGSPFSTRKLLQCYDDGARRFGWSKRDPTPGAVREGEWLIGLGMATATRVNFLAESEARVILAADGHAIVETDMTDIGTGTYTILAQVAAEMLGLPIERVEVRLGDTDYPASSGSGGSFGAASSASSVALACDDIIADLATRMNATPDELVLKNGIATARNMQTSLVDLLKGDNIRAHGKIIPGKTSRAFSQAAHGAQFAEVAVSAVTGEVRVRRMLGVFDCGKILNAKTARSQALGGMIWGLSYALHEEAIVDKRTGAFVTRDLAEYHIPVHADVPPIEIHFIEEPDRHANPLGVKGLGELGNAGAGAAVTNAIYNACGVRAREFPLTVDRILPYLPPM